MSITTPGISRKVITVGCSDDDREVLVGGNRMVDYSGRVPPPPASASRTSLLRAAASSAVLAGRINTPSKAAPP